MDLHLDLEEEEVEYLESIGLADSLGTTLTQALKSLSSEQPPEPLLSLVVEGMARAAGKGLSTWTAVCGIPVTCKPEVSLSLGPVVGEVTSTSAIIMLEVANPNSPRTEVTCHIHRKGGKEHVQEQTIAFPYKTPKVFVFRGETALEPNTEYVAVFSGICREDAARTFAMFKTKPEEIKSFKIIALSCDRPDRMLLGQKNPWYELARKSYHADVMLHLGDQVYNKGEDSDNTQQLFGTEYEAMKKVNRERMKKRARALLRKKYRETWNKKMTRESLQKGCHLMIWSDNDVANDFTTLKNVEGGQAYPAPFLQCGIEVYRQYQRILWDPECANMPAENEHFQEFHSHVYGPVGIFLIDMRGNRITGDGVQHSTNPIMGEEQWNAIEEFFQTEELKVIILAAEIPFVGDDPESIQLKAEKFDFLTDHWPYNLQDLERLLDLCFGWKNQDEDGREVLLLGGDIHCGVTSVIR